MDPLRIQPAQAHPRGFTLLELMVTIAMIGVLLSILTPSLMRAIGNARSVQCQATLRDVALDFIVFADPTMHTPRGHDEPLRNRFRLSTFQESEYRIDEFWGFGAAQEARLDPGKGRDKLRCSEVAGSVTVSKNQPCTSTGAINPPQHVSYGFNSRLHRAEVRGPGGFPLPKPVFLTAEILSEPDVPLLWDVDGDKAFAKRVLPQFSAPALGSKSIYAADRFWFPSFRHGGRMNVAFVGGHVLSTRKPLDEAGWRWDYQPVR